MERKTLVATYREALLCSLESFSQRAQENRGQVALEVDPGCGEVLGQLLCHALLSVVPGFAVTRLKLSYEGEEGRTGVIPHAYARIPGVVEDVRQIMAHIGRVTLRLVSRKQLVCSAEVHGPRTVTAQDLFTHPHIELHTPEVHIATLTGPVHLWGEFTIEAGTGFHTFPGGGLDILLLPVDAVFQPVQKVRVAFSESQGRQRVEWAIDTRGNVSPREAWEYAVRHVLKEVEP